MCCRFCLRFICIHSCIWFIHFSLKYNNLLSNFITICPFSYWWNFSSFYFFAITVFLCISWCTRVRVYPRYLLRNDSTRLSSVSPGNAKTVFRSACVYKQLLFHCIWYEFPLFRILVNTWYFLTAKFLLIW